MTTHQTPPNTEELADAIKLLKLTKKWLLDCGEKEACARRIQKVVNLLEAQANLSTLREDGGGVRIACDQMLKTIKEQVRVNPSAWRGQQIAVQIQKWEAALKNPSDAQPQADTAPTVDLEGLKREVSDYVFGKNDEFLYQGSPMDKVSKILHYLAAQGYLNGVPDGYAIVPIEKQFDGKTFRLVAAEYSCLQDISLTVRDMSVLKAAPKKEGE